MANLTSSALQELVVAALARAGMALPAANETAQALVYADERGLSSHGVSRLPMYVAQLCNGRVDAGAQAVVLPHARPGAAVVDAADGLAFPACALAVATLIDRARVNGSAVVAVVRSHHFGAAAHHLERLAQAGMVGLVFSNTPAAMPAWGGRRPLFGTNPIAAVFPRRDDAPLMIDLSMSQVARGKIMVAARDGKSIPEGWATDRDGQPTTDAKQALDGMMLPFGGTKGAMLALMVELLAVTLSGASFGFEAGSFLTAEGEKSRVGHVFWAIDPGALAGTDVYLSRIETLIEIMQQDPEVRLPGARREVLAQTSRRDGIDIPDALLAQLQALRQ